MSSRILRSSHRSCSIKKLFLKVSKHSQENECFRVSFNEVSGLRPTTLLKNGFQHRCFPVNMAKFLRTPNLKNIFERLLLDSIANVRNISKDHLKYVFPGVTINNF